MTEAKEKPTAGPRATARKTVVLALKSLIGPLRTEEDRRVVSKDEVSPHFLNALIATEDHRFYEHRGVAPRAFLRAVGQYLTGTEEQTGGEHPHHAAGEEHLAHPRAHRDAQSQRSGSRPPPRAAVFQRQNPQGLPQCDLLRQGRPQPEHLRHSGGSRGIFGVDARTLNLAQAAYLAG